MAQRPRQIAPDVFHVPVSIANIYMVQSPGSGWVLIDTGLPGHAREIVASAQACFGDVPPAAILLTHGHYDHSGNAAELSDYWDVPVFAHLLELPYLTGKSPYPPLDATAPGFMSFLSRFFSNRTVDLGARVLPLDGGTPGLPAWQWYHTPGHAPGHVVFFRSDDATLIAGDAITTVNLDSPLAIAVKKRRVSRPPTPSTYDWTDARDSVRLLADLMPLTLATGHGAPMSGEKAFLQLEDLAWHFPMPSHGRYAAEPAVADETGIVSLPPPVPDAFPVIATGVGLAAVTATMVAIAARRRKQSVFMGVNRHPDTQSPPA